MSRDLRLRPGRGALLAICTVALALACARAGTQSPGRRIGLVQDWTMRHAIFPRVGPPAAMYSLQHDPRARVAWQSALVAAARSAPHSQTLGVRLSARSSELRAQRDSASHTDWSVNLGAQGTGAAMSPAKFSFDINATPSCSSDFVVFPVNQAPGAAAENLVAFDNLYSGTIPSNGLCNRTASASDDGVSATVLWSYAISSADAGGVMTSPTLSLDGTRVAFVTSKAGQQPHFHVLAWKSGDGVNPLNAQDARITTKLIAIFSSAAPAAGSGAATDLAFGAAAGGDTLSSPFTDYGRDFAYVGDDKGDLVRIQNVFCSLTACGGAAPSIDTSWGSSGTVSVPCAAELTGPVEDVVTGNVFVGCSDGKLYGFNSSGAALANSPLTVGNNTATGAILDAPVVDGANGFVYAFAGNSASGHAIVVQAKTDLSSPVNVAIGPGGVFAVHAGALNDAYFNGTAASAFLYSCGYNGGSTHTFLYWIGFGAGLAMNATYTGHGNTPISSSECSPMTEFFNGSDSLFLGQGPPGSVVQAYPIATSKPGTPTSVTEQGGTSGIIVDNVSTAAQASSIYFSSQGSQACGAGGTGVCAVKLTQSALQ